MIREAGFAAAVALALAGCAVSSTAPAPSAASTQAALESSLMVAETSAAAYENAPGANPAVVAKIKKADSVAYTAVTGNASPADAEADIAALAAVVPAAQTPVGAAVVAGVGAVAALSTMGTSTAAQSHAAVQAAP